MEKLLNSFPLVSDRSKSESTFCGSFGFDEKNGCRYSTGDSDLVYSGTSGEQLLKNQKVVETPGILTHRESVSLVVMRLRSLSVFENTQFSIWKRKREHF